MSKLAASICALAVAAAGCAGPSLGPSGTVSAGLDSGYSGVPGDPVGSANSGTGSVTIGSSVPYEAKAAGIGLAP
jgi:hypothetical protein